MPPTSKCSPSTHSPVPQLAQGDIDTARALCELADRRMESASHFITDRDRTDAHAVRQHLPPMDRGATQHSEESEVSKSTQLAHADTS